VIGGAALPLRAGSSILRRCLALVAQVGNPRRVCLWWLRAGADQVSMSDWVTVARVQSWVVEPGQEPPGVCELLTDCVGGGGSERSDRGARGQSRA